MPRKQINLIWAPDGAVKKSRSSLTVLSSLTNPNSFEGKRKAMANHSRGAAQPGIYPSNTQSYQISFL